MKRPASYAVRIARVLLIALLLFVSAHLLLQYLNLNVYDEKNGFIFELSNRFDLDDEISVSTWFSQVLLFSIGIGGFLAAYLERKRVVRRLWVFIGAIGVLLSLDEASSLHEFILQSLHNVFYLNAAPDVAANAWWLVSPFILVGATAITWLVYSYLPRRTFFVFFAGGFVFLTGAVLVDVVASVATTSPFIKQGILVAIEEVFELIGTITVLYGLADFLERSYRPQLSSAKRQLKGHKP